MLNIFDLLPVDVTRSKAENDTMFTYYWYIFSQILDRGENHMLEIFGNSYEKSEIAYAIRKNLFEKEKSRTPNAEVIYPLYQT